MKTCTKCRIAKPLDAFHVDASRADGRTYVCISCRGRRDGHATKPQRTAARLRGLAWCRDCLDWQPIDQVRQGLCRGHQRAADRKRYATVASVRFRAQQRVRARRRGILPLAPEHAALRLELFNGECAYCDNLATTWDHVVPVSRGGDTTADNTVPACGRCNSSKRDREMWAWLDATNRFPDACKIDQLVMIAGPPN